MPSWWRKGKGEGKVGSDEVTLLRRSVSSVGKNCWTYKMARKKASRQIRSIGIDIDFISNDRLSPNA